ncbi:uncharacterized protein LOC113788928 [Dermatophagoides pteronyssinus]|uniref:uncharacterized protein LOC113788928 n=1 Tax=Dermatophagoides pteronyssinus TaxID=6956 RepID=UPI003F668216
MENIIINLFGQLLQLNQQRINNWNKIQQLQGSWNTFKLSLLDPAFKDSQSFSNEFQSKIDELYVLEFNDDQMDSLAIIGDMIDKLNPEIDDFDEKIRITIQNCQTNRLVRKKIIDLLRKKFNDSNSTTVDNNNNVINETLMNIDDHEPQTTSNGSTQIKPLTTTIEIAESNSISDNGDQLPLITNHRSNIQNRPNRRHQSNQQFYQGKRRYRCPDCKRSFRSNPKRRDHQSKCH